MRNDPPRGWRWWIEAHHVNPAPIVWAAMGAIVLLWLLKHLPA